MHAFLKTALLGCACAVAALLAGRAAGSVVATWSVWLISLGLVAFLAGRAWPKRGLEHVAVLMLVQPLVLLLFTGLSGEVTEPGSSTGGLVGWLIATLMLLAATPLPLVAAWLGAWRARSETARPG